MSVLEMVSQGRPLAMLLWQRKTILLYAMRCTGNTPFCYLIHRETRDLRGRNPVILEEDVDLSKALP